jgi:hypothetical protein
VLGQQAVEAGGDLVDLEDFRQRREGLGDAEGAAGDDLGVGDQGQGDERVRLVPVVLEPVGGPPIRLVIQEGAEPAPRRRARGVADQLADLAVADAGQLAPGVGEGLGAGVGVPFFEDVAGGGAVGLLVVGDDRGGVDDLDAGQALGDVVDGEQADGAQGGAQAGADGLVGLEVGVGQDAGDGRGDRGGVGDDGDGRGDGHAVAAGGVDGAGPDVDGPELDQAVDDGEQVADAGVHPAVLAELVGPVVDLGVVGGVLPERPHEGVLRGAGGVGAEVPLADRVLLGGGGGGGQAPGVDPSADGGDAAGDPRGERPHARFCHGGRSPISVDWGINWGVSGCGVRRAGPAGTGPSGPRRSRRGN